MTTTKTYYPWSNWTNGEMYTIYKGSDYFISTHNMQISLHGRARHQKLKVETTSFTNPDGQEGLVFRFQDKKE